MTALLPTGKRFSSLLLAVVAFALLSPRPAQAAWKKLSQVDSSPYLFRVHSPDGRSAR